VFASRREALQAERDAIRTEHPVENRQRYVNTPVASEPIAWNAVRDTITGRISQQLDALERAGEMGADVDELLNELAASADQMAAAGGNVSTPVIGHLVAGGRWPPHAA